MSLKAIMVDVDGVIFVHPNPDGWSANLEADLGLSPARLSERFFAPHWNEIITGRADLHERLGKVLGEIAPHLTSQTLVDYWFANDGHMDCVLLDDLAAIRAGGVALHLATVQEHERARYLWDALELSDRFDAMHYAADLGVAKPHDAFFAAIEARTGFAPQEMFFIDDKTENIEAARRRGWRAAIWSGDRRLAEVLAEAGYGDLLPAVAGQRNRPPAA